MISPRNAAPAPKMTHSGTPIAVPSAATPALCPPRSTAVAIAVAIPNRPAQPRLSHPNSLRASAVSDIPCVIFEVIAKSDSYIDVNFSKRVESSRGVSSLPMREISGLIVENSTVAAIESVIFLKSEALEFFMASNDSAHSARAFFSASLAVEAIRSRRSFLLLSLLAI